MGARFEALPIADRAELSRLLIGLRGHRTRAWVARMADVPPRHVEYLESCPAAPLAAALGRARTRRVVETLLKLAAEADRDEIQLRINRLAGGV